MDTIEATQLIWKAAGSPEPCDTKGEVISTCRGEGHCARCGSPNGKHSIAQLVSQNFLPTRNSNRLAAFGGWRYCPACMFAAKALRLRCIAWFASAEGVRFYRTQRENKGDAQPDALESLLNPPSAPFVAGLPLYGIAHGGENNWLRTWWPGEPLPADPLIKLQSKHTALYARTAYSRDRYPVQVDDDRELLLDRDTWLFARDDAYAIMRVLVDDGRKPWQARKSLGLLVLPVGTSLPIARRWTQLTQPLMPHVSTTWWPIFCSLIGELGGSNEETGQGTVPHGHPHGDKGRAPTVGVPTASNSAEDELRQAREASLPDDPQRAFEFAHPTGRE